MKRFNGIVKKRNKALGIFEVTKNKLTKICKQVEDEIKSSLKVIRQEEEAVHFLNSEATTMKTTISNINKIIGVDEPVEEKKEEVTEG